MILDSLNNVEKYYAFHPLFKDAFEYLKNVDFSKAEEGKTELKGKDLFVIVSDSKLKNKDEAKLEAHNEYIDIQLPISKAETFGWKGRANIKQPLAPFDTEKDIQFYADEPTSFFSLSPGDFVIFYPEDAHAPCIGEDLVRKVVVKMRLK